MKLYLNNRFSVFPNAEIYQDDGVFSVYLLYSKYNMTILVAANHEHALLIANRLARVVRDYSQEEL